MESTGKRASRIQIFAVASKEGTSVSIRLKLILLVLLAGISGSSSILVYEAMLRPVRRIAGESEVFGDLRNQFEVYASQVNRLDSESYREQMGAIRDAKENLDSAFEQVE
jgi:hypothetical protein